jgi:hypothetical protein
MDAREVELLLLKSHIKYKYLMYNSAARTLEILV